MNIVNRNYEEMNHRVEEPPPSKLKNHYREDERHHRHVENLGVIVEENKGRAVEENKRGVAATT